MTTAYRVTLSTPANATLKSTTEVRQNTFAAIAHHAAMFAAAHNLNLRDILISVTEV